MSSLENNSVSSEENEDIATSPGSIFEVLSLWNRSDRRKLWDVRVQMAKTEELSKFLEEGMSIEFPVCCELFRKTYETKYLRKALERGENVDHVFLGTPAENLCSTEAGSGYLVLCSPRVSSVESEWEYGVKSSSTPWTEEQLHFVLKHLHVNVKQYVPEMKMRIVNYLLKKYPSVENFTLALEMFQTHSAEWKSYRSKFNKLFPHDAEKFYR